MFVIELVYKAPLEEIDAHMTAHVRFLGLADFRVIEFRASQKADDIQNRIESS